MPTFRGALRNAAQVALIAADTVVGENVQIEYDWPATQAEPAISVNTPKWRYEDRTRGTGVPQFWATIWLGIECRLSQPDADGSGRPLLVDQMDALSDQVDDVMAQFIIGPPQLFRRIPSVDGDYKITSSGAQHQGDLTLFYGFEYPLDGQAQITTQLENVRLAFIRKLRAGGRVGQSLVRVLGGFDLDIPQL